MIILIVKLLINALAIFLTARVVPGVELGGLGSALIVALVLGFINAVIRPALLLLTLPINFITLGLFTFVVNALLILLASYLVDSFHIPSFWTALLFSVILSVISSILTWIAK
jgi:putative membrane protein